MHTYILGLTYGIFGINATPPGCRGSAMSHVLFALTSYESGMTQISGQYIGFDPFGSP
jgi:hypothetical protein